MGKFKDKLYYFLVEKNPSIREEYQGYINSHQDEHQKSRKKSWKLLLKLNWHYRVLRKKTRLIPLPPRTNTRLPYLDGSESMADKHIPIISLYKNVLCKYDVISFDVFDTLILRPFDDPKTLFIILGEQLGIYDFYTIRVSAEQEAREAAYLSKGNREVTIDDIYEIIEKKTGLNAKYGASLEFELEKKYCFANPYFKTLFKILKEYGKSIVICSDMYLYSHQIDEILKNAGYEGYDEVIVSCENNSSKRNGGLFDLEKQKYPRNKIIHVGDNYQSDNLSAKARGIDAFYYENVNEAGKKYRAEGLSALTGSLYNGIINTTLLNGFDKFDVKHEFGFTYGGLYVLGYANWINETAKKDGVDKVLFLSRDGDIYSRVYDMLPDHLDWEYFHWSRIVGMKVGVEENFHEFITRMIYHKAGSVNRPRVTKLLESLELEFLIDEMPKYGLKELEVLNQDNKKIVEMLFVDNKRRIIEAYQHNIDLTYAMIRRSIKGCKKVAVVDVGWAGSGPLGIKYIIENKLGVDCKVECYLAASNHHIQQLPAATLMNGDVKVYTFTQMLNRINYDSHRNTNKTMNNLFFEMFTQACMPTFAGYSDNGMAFDTPEVENYESIRKIHEGILAFADKYIKTFGDKKYLLNISGYDAYLPFRMIKKNIKLIKEQFGDLCMSRGVLSDTEHQKIETLLDLINQVNL